MSEYHLVFEFFLPNPKVILIYKVSLCSLQNSCSYSYRNTTSEENVGEVSLYHVFLGVRFKLAVFLCFIKKLGYFTFISSCFQ